MEDRWTAEPRGDNPEDVKAAELATKLLNYLDREGAVTRSTGQAAAQSLALGRPLSQAEVEAIVRKNA